MHGLIKGLLVCGILSLLFIAAALYNNFGTVSAAKTYDAASKTVSITDGIKPIAEYQLLYNTKYCLNDCHSIGIAKLFKDEKLFDSIEFLGRDSLAKQQMVTYKVYILNGTKDKSQEICKEYKQEVLKNFTVVDKCVTIAIENYPVENWQEYNYEVLPAGEYKWLLTGQKKAQIDIDWIATVATDIKLDEWGWWETNGLDDDLVNYYNMNEQSGVVIYDSVGYYNGTISGPDINISGIINTAYNYSTAGDYASVVGLNTSTYKTWNFWAYGYPTTSGFLIVKYISGSNYEYGMYLNNAGYITIFGNGVSYELTPHYNNNAWQMFTFVKDDTTWRIYVNATSLANRTAFATGSGTATTYFGSRAGSYTFHRGKQDEIGIWNRALNQSEITLLYNSSAGVTWGEAAASSTCTCPGLATNWNISLGDHCVISTACNISSGNITYYSTGNITWNATVQAHSFGQLPANERGYVGSSAALKIQ
jgi:hypothetical protein